MDKSKLDMWRTFFLALLTGICLSASYTTLFYYSVVSFSIFPFIGLGLSLHCLHQRYLIEAIPPGGAIVIILLGLLGFFIYSVVIRVEYPVLGHNLFQTFIVLGLIFWIYHRFKSLNLAKMTTVQKE